MLRRSFAIAIIVAVSSLLVHAETCAAGEAVPFKGTLEASYSVTVVPPIGTFTGGGTGNGTHLGRFTYEFPHTVDFSATPPAGAGTYTFTAANGDTLIAEFTGFSTPLEPGLVLVEEEAVIVGGTGRFANASGEFTITRLVDQVNRTTTGFFDGTISRGANNP